MRVTSSVPTPATSLGTALAATAVDALRRSVIGRVAYPADPAYAALRGRGDPASVLLPTPSVVVAAQSEDDVVAAVVVAGTHGLCLVVAPVEPGRRSATPEAPARPVLLLLTDGLRDLTLDPAGATAVAGAGVTWADLAAVAAEHGLDVPAPSRRTPLVVPTDGPGRAAGIVGARVVGVDGFVRVVEDVADRKPDEVIVSVTVALGGGTVV